jgi:hypothetical protein
VQKAGTTLSQVLPGREALVGAAAAELDASQPSVKVLYHVLVESSDGLLIGSLGATVLIVGAQLKRPLR